MHMRYCKLFLVDLYTYMSRGGRKQDFNFLFLAGSIILLVL